MARATDARADGTANTSSPRTAARTQRLPKLAHEPLFDVSPKSEAAKQPEIVSDTIVPLHTAKPALRNPST